MSNRRHHCRIIVGAAVLCVSLAACTESGGTLGGSLSQIYRLNFTEIRARLYDSHMSIEYVAPGQVVPVRISLDRRSVALGENTFDLTNGGEIAGRLRSGVEIPRFTTGQITFSEFGESAGTPIRGTFSATFDIDNRSFGLEGRFGADLEVVELPAPAPDPAAAPTTPDASVPDAAP